MFVSIGNSYLKSLIEKVLSKILIILVKVLGQTSERQNPEKKIYTNANIMKTQIFHKIKYDLKDHWRSQKVTFLSKNTRFLGFNYCLKTNLFKTLYQCQHYEGQIRPLQCQYLSRPFIYEPITMKIYINVNNLKTIYLYWVKYDLGGHERSQKVIFYLKIFFFKSNLLKFGQNVRAWQN